MSNVNLTRIALNDREFMRRLIDTLRLATHGGTVTDLTITAHQAEILYNIIKVADAAACCITACKEAGLHELAGCAEHLINKMADVVEQVVLPRGP